MAHSTDRRSNIVVLSFSAASMLLTAMVITAPTAQAAAKNTTPEAKRPVGVASTIPTVGPVPIEVGDGTDGVNRDEVADAFLGGPGWVCPVPGSTFRNDWGNARSGGRRHQGTDMFAAMGADVLAPVSGTVKRHESGLAGLSFYLAGSDGVQYFGAHLSQLVKTGSVRAGDVIARVGDSGNARGGTPHLHFEIHPTKKTKTNPYATLSVQCAGLAAIK